nr:reverse transcriptase domain-containing protein [Tanacetum cinerariifolium]
MSTRSSARNLFPPLDNPELTIRRRSRTDLTFLNNSKMAAEGPGDLPVPDLRTMEELCQPSLNGRGGPIAPIAIQATNFGLKNDMIQQVQNSCQLHGLPGDDANKHLDKFLHVTQSIIVNGVTDNALRLYLFPHSLTHYATAWFDCLPRNSINTFEQMATMFLEKYFPPSMVTKLRNEITNFRGTFMKRRPEECYDRIENMTAHHNDWDTLAPRSESSSSITSSFDTEIAALKAEMAKINKNLMRVLQVKQQVKVVTLNCETCGGPHSFSDCPTTVGNTQNVYVVGAYQEHETEATKDTVHPTNNRSTKDVQSLVIQSESPILNSDPVNSPTIEHVASPVSALKPNLRPSIPYPSRLQDQKLRDKANDQQVSKKLGDPGKFLIPCDFPEMAECLALADLGASINLMPLSMWNKLFLPDLSPTCMTLELADRSISRSVEVAEDVYVKVGTFHFSADFVVVDFDADPRVPLILERSFLKTGRALIDVFEGELTLRVGKEAITFNLDQTSRYSANYNDIKAKRIDIIDLACEEYSQEVLGFSDVIVSSNPTPYYDPIISTTSSTLTPFGNSDFLLEEVDAFLAIEDDPTSPEVELKDLPPHLEYAFMEGGDKLPVIIVKDLSMEEKTALIMVLRSYKRAIAWKLSDIKGIDPGFCTHKILMEEDFEPAVQHQRRVNHKSKMLSNKREISGKSVLFFLDGFSGYFQIPIDSKDQEKTTFTWPYGTFAYRRMPFGLCNAPGTFQRCMMAIFHDMINKTMEVFMDDFLVFGNSFQSCLSYLEKMLKSDFAIGAVLEKRQEKHFRPIHYASKTMTEAESNYTTTEKEMLAVVYAFEKFRSYLIMNKSIVYTDHSALKYLFAKKDSKARLLRWVLLLQEFTFKVIDTKGAENLAADHLS